MYIKYAIRTNYSLACVFFLVYFNLTQLEICVYWITIIIKSEGNTKMTIHFLVYYECKQYWLVLREIVQL